MGFLGPANLGPGWVVNGEPQRADFDALDALPFRYLLSAFEG
jgi:hypothetical protein